jgi:hypothetical protein
VLVVNSLESNGFESLLNQTKKLQYHNNGTINLIDGNIEDDKLIGDDRLAMLLNNNREIVVGNVVYKYEAEVVYFSSLPTNNIKQKINLNKGFATGNIDNLENEKVHTIGSNLKLFKYNYLQGIAYENSNANHAKSNNQLVNNPYNLESCNYDDSGFFKKIFGSSEVCIQNINETKRIRTKFSNQNYFFFKSTYAKLKSQKKTKIGWWKKDNFCDFLELGRTIVLKYPIEYPSIQTYGKTFLVKNNSTNTIIDSDGKIVNTTFNTTQDVFDNFPFDSSSFNFEIYYYVSSYKPNPQEINKLISDALQGLLTSLGKSYDNLFGPTNNTNVGITLDTPDGIYVTEYNAKTKHYGVSKIERFYDKNNFEISYKSSVENFFENLIRKIGDGLLSNKKQPEVILLDVYGIGSYQGNIYGSRIIKGGLIDENNNEIDSDGDGFPDTNDLCRFQAGYKKYNGCPYSLKDEETLHTNRINKINDNLTVNGDTKNIGSYNKLQLKSSDYPLQSNHIKGGVYPKYNIIAGESINIKGNTNLSIKPEGITNTINLKILSTPNQFTTPISAKKSEEKKKGYTIKKLDYENTSSGKEIAIYPNPSSNVFNISTNSTITSYKIINQIGKTVLVNRPLGNNFEIDIQKYPSGIYFMQLQFDDGKTEMKKLIKK